MGLLPPEMLSPGANAPGENWVDFFRRRVAQHPAKRAVTFLENGETEAGHLTFAQLDRRAQSVAARLQAVGACDERVLLIFASGLDFVAAFLGCLYAGAVAVPLHPPRLNRNLDRLDTIVENATPSFVLTTAAILERIESHVPTGFPLQWLALEAEDDRSSEWRPPALSAGSLAFLQFTSGSTAAPKGVRITHGNLICNHRMIGAAFEQTADFTLVSWLPLFHDMGLIGTLLQGLFAGNHCVLMPPEAFVLKPVRWLQAISRYAAQASGGPNFAYDWCVRKITPQQCAGLDLRPWELAFCGSEPVRGATLQRFSHTFAPWGFRKSAFYPCYGLAEATLFVAGGDKQTPPTIASFDAAALEANRAETVPAEAENARDLVSCGWSWGHETIVIVAPDTGAPCPAGRVGEVWVRGPHVADSYWEASPESQAHFEAYLPSGGPFLRTGDLGFFHAGELFLTGRLKDLIIIAGRNHYPSDIEATVAASHPALRPGACAAFACDGKNGEILTVVAEVERTHLAGLDAEALAQAVRCAVGEAHDLSVSALHLILPATLPKTSSGKIQRAACRAALLAGTLRPIACDKLES